MKKIIFAILALVVAFCFTACRNSQVSDINKVSDIKTDDDETEVISDDSATDAISDINECNGHKYVDLGLSVNWATMNIGATSPEDYGDYFAWGETTPKSTYSWNNYFDSVDSYGDVFKKYTGEEAILDPEDDAAHVNWGGDWRMPTREELKELKDYCTWTWTTQNGVKGYKVTSKKNGNYIFLPATGGKTFSYYWSSEQGGSPGSKRSEAHYLFISKYIDENSYFVSFGGRFWGRSVRAVYPVHNRDNTISTNKKDIEHEYVDLGLSVKWATMNVGATSPEDYGDYFAWGETTPKSYYMRSTYFDFVSGSVSNFKKYYNENGGKTMLELEDDAAHVNWGGDWRMPTREEQKELQDNCIHEKTTQNGVEGYKFTSKKNGNSIFLPSAGYMKVSSLNGGGSLAWYWSNSLKSSFEAYCLDYYYDRRSSSRYFGQSVRAVCP